MAISHRLGVSMGVMCRMQARCRKILFFLKLFRVREMSALGSDCGHLQQAQPVKTDTGPLMPLQFGQGARASSCTTPTRKM